MTAVRTDPYTRSMTSYQDRLQQLTDAHTAIDQQHPQAADSWRDAHRAAALALLLDAAGHPCSNLEDPSAVAALLDQVSGVERGTLRWLAHTADIDSLVGVAALLDHARSRQAG